MISRRFHLPLLPEVPDSDGQERNNPVAIGIFDNDSSRFQTESNSYFRILWKKRLKVRTSLNLLEPPMQEKTSHLDLVVCCWDRNCQWSELKDEERCNKSVTARQPYTAVSTQCGGQEGPSGPLLVHRVPSAPPRWPWRIENRGRMSISNSKFGIRGSGEYRSEYVWIPYSEVLCVCLWIVFRYFQIFSLIQDLPPCWHLFQFVSVNVWPASVWVFWDVALVPDPSCVQMIQKRPSWRRIAAQTASPGFKFRNGQQRNVQLS